jgi:hypothetical protein
MDFPQSPFISSFCVLNGSYDPWSGRNTIQGSIFDAGLAFSGSDQVLPESWPQRRMSGHPFPSGPAELKQKAAAACDPNTPLRLRYQCLHGLGHALMFFSRYQLDQSLEACDALGDDWSRNSCYGGVFMENVANGANEKRNFSAMDYHYPCDRVAERYRRECYTMQTPRMTEMGLAPERMLEECAKAGAYRLLCTQVNGRDLSHQARLGEAQSVAQKCELAQDENRLIRIVNKIRPGFVRRIHPQPREKPRDAQSALTFSHSIMPPTAMADSAFGNPEQRGRLPPCGRHKLMRQ